jgi:prevent-host-death family protein
MITVDTSEAKAHLSALLEHVARGEEVVITRRGQPIARLMPAVAADAEEVGTLIARIKALRAGQTLGRRSWRDLRDQGRR